MSVNKLFKRIYKLIIKKFNDMFFWFGIQLFDSSRKECGGFNHFIAGVIFRWKFDYIVICIRKQWSFKWIHEDKEFYYDGYHNCINIGILQISYGT